MGMQALDLGHKIKWEKGIALAFGSIASNYQYKSDYPNAFEYDFKALKKFETIRGQTRHGQLPARSIGTVYQYEKNYPKAQEYNLSALKIFEQIGDKENLFQPFQPWHFLFFTGETMIKQ